MPTFQLHRGAVRLLSRWLTALGEPLGRAREGHLGGFSSLWSPLAISTCELRLSLGWHWACRDRYQSQQCPGLREAAATQDPEEEDASQGRTSLAAGSGPLPGVPPTVTVPLYRWRSGWEVRDRPGTTALRWSY